MYPVTIPPLEELKVEDLLHYQDAFLHPLPLKQLTMKNEQLSSADENYVDGPTKSLIYRQRRSCSQYGAQEIGGPDVNVSNYALNFYRANFLPRR